MATLRKVERIYKDAHPNMVGDGFRVYNAFPNGNRIGLRRLSPFFLLDYGAPHYFPPTNVPRGVDEHPHRGFETVTLAFQGAVQHRDSSGSRGVIGEGDVQWMTAASGVVHEEKHEQQWAAKGGIMEMVQLWVNLPAAHKMDTPRYQTLTKEQIPVQALDDKGSCLRVITGSYQDLKGPAKTFTPLTLLDVRLKAGQELSLSFPEQENTALYLRAGSHLRIHGREEAEEMNLVIFEHKGTEITVQAVNDANFLVLSGEPIEEPVVAYGPFVMNSKEEISQAIQDYNAGKMGHLPVQ